MKSITQLLLVLFSIALYSQSPWVQEKGKIYTQISFTTISNYNSLFGESNFNENANFTDNTIHFYGEYGLTNKTTLLLSLPYKKVSINDFEDPRVDCVSCEQNFTENAFGNSTIGIKHNFLNSNWLLTGQLNIETNTGSYFKESGIRTGFDALTINPIISAGKGFRKTYIQAFLSAEIRTNNYSSNLRFGGELGYKIAQPIWLIGFVDISNSLKNGDVTLPIQNQFTGLYVNDIAFGAFGIKGIAEITNNFGLTTGFASAFSGNNVPKQAAITFGLYQKL